MLQSYDYDENGQTVSFYESKSFDCEKHVLSRSLQIRIGAKVSGTQNLDQDSGVINGTRGFVKAVHRKVVIIEEEHTKELIPVTKVKQKIHIMRTNGTYYRVPFPLILSWVSTIHKGQGSISDTLHGYIDEAVSADGHAYTATSRVRRLEDLHITKLHPDAIKTSSTVRVSHGNGKGAQCPKSVPVYDHLVCTQPTSSIEARTIWLGQHKDVGSSPDRNKHLQLPDNMSLSSELRCVHLHMGHLGQESIVIGAVYKAYEHLTVAGNLQCI